MMHSEARPGKLLFLAYASAQDSNQSRSAQEEGWGGKSKEDPEEEPRERAQPLLSPICGDSSQTKRYPQGRA